MFTILKSMIKEEWRFHASLFGNLLFGLFPVLILLFSFTGSLLSPIIGYLGDPTLVILCFFILFGLTVGSFGLLGRKVMNRRFGQASMIAYSSRTLPVSLKMIFFNFYVKDLIYYFLFWILPYSAGVFLGALLGMVTLKYAFMLFIAVSFSFLFGLSFSFLFSTLYVHLEKLTSVLMGIVFVLLLFSKRLLGVDVLSMLPSYRFMLDGDYFMILLWLIILGLMSFMSILFMKADYASPKRQSSKNYLEFHIEKFGRYIKGSHFIVKDFLDMARSRGGLGKVLFSFIIPVMFVWFLLEVFTENFPVVNFAVLFSLFFGAITSTIYNLLTEFEIFSSYEFLPVTPSMIIKAKLRTFVLVNIISPFILFFVLVKTGSLDKILLCFTLFFTMSFLSLAVTVFLTGLSPNIMLYNAKVFLGYIAMLLPVLLIVMMVSIVNMEWLYLSWVLLLPGMMLFRMGFNKWDMAEQKGF
ncbi:MAG: hypothetical protein KKF44_01285 [Nanoarchaeota archaeon]|nr:hypothetical protein [Nanoarchaeota archaeon]